MFLYITEDVRRVWVFGIERASDIDIAERKAIAEGKDAHAQSKISCNKIV